MLQKTYSKIQKLFRESYGYLRTSELLQQGVTTLQIRQLVEAGSVEKISHGIYWWLDDGREKPELSRYIEVEMADRKSVICMESALYLAGLLKKEPKMLSVATSRTDRSRIHMNYPIKRRYFSEPSINDYVETLDTPCGPVRYYSVDRSVVDCIRLRSELEDGALEKIMKKYNSLKTRDVDAFLAYAETMGLQRVAKSFLS